MGGIGFTVKSHEGYPYHPKDDMMNSSNHEEQDIEAESAIYTQVDAHGVL